MKLGRNDPCYCGSGKKYKKCCLEKDEALAREQASRSLLPKDDDESARREEVVGEDGYKYEEEYADTEDQEDESANELDEQTAALNARLYFVDMLRFFDSQYYDVAATFELLPAWLRFLEARRLIDHDLHLRALGELNILQKDLIRFFQVFQDDPMPAQAIQRWGEGAQA